MKKVAKVGNEGVPDKPVDPIRQRCEGRSKFIPDLFIRTEEAKQSVFQNNFIMARVRDSRFEISISKGVSDKPVKNGNPININKELRDRKSQKTRTKKTQKTRPE